MRHTYLRRFALTVLLAPILGAWSPRFHEAQTTLAVKLAPHRMAQFLRSHSEELLQGARGQNSDQVPTVEEVEEQFQRIVALTEQKRRPALLVKELGILAHQIQLLMDPSAIHGATPLRDAFEAYGDEKLVRLVLSREPFWAVRGPLDPRPALLRWTTRKFERNTTLQPFFDDKTGRRVGPWDDLSLPFAELQLAYSNGVHATANGWILLWRAVGDQWDVEPGARVLPNR
jgi:hypothetical protein